MPTYAYACKQCGHRFDAVQSFSEPALTECPECSGALRKEYGSIGVTFNGSGFYRTDSRSDSGSGTGAKAASKGGDSGASSTSSSSATSAPAKAESTSKGASS